MLVHWKNVCVFCHSFQKNTKTSNWILKPQIFHQDQGSPKFFGKETCGNHGGLTKVSNRRFEPKRGNGRLLGSYGCRSCKFSNYCVSLYHTQKKRYGNKGVSTKKMRDVVAFVSDSNNFAFSFATENTSSCPVVESKLLKLKSWVLHSMPCPPVMSKHRKKV